MLRTFQENFKGLMFNPGPACSLGGFDDGLINWGDSFETMLNKLISGKKGDLQIIEF